eukprot:TRINITY_DN9058_c0_g1_i1.p1 TRINITY_DN9058_c0_g1~~TRINITY_DN9058_c0_g1_i1.p1  ORF type:complete len:306 (-),score=80.35 TRINITY_DN9058_c0_g1_i1:10-927(-)
MQRFWGEHGKMSFYHWTGQETHTHKRPAERTDCVSTNRARRLLDDAKKLLGFAKTALNALSSAVGAFEGGSAASAAAQQPTRPSSAAALVAPRHVGNAWNAASSGGEMPETDLYYRATFQAQLVDEGILKALSSRILTPGDALGDFGASLGGYSKFLNLTGLFSAFAFDGAQGIASVTKGRVQPLLLHEPFQLWRTFDWVLCLEVLEHIPQKFEQVALANLRRHARKGAVISWAREYTNYLDPLHVNGKDEADVAAALRDAGFERDEDLTTMLRAVAQQWWLASSVAAYRVSESDAARSDAAPRL